MSIAFKIVILLIYILALAGCIFWWKKEGGWEPKIATLTMITTLALFIYDYLNELKKEDSNSIVVSENNNSPIANNIGVQNIYYSNIDTSSASKKSETAKLKDIKDKKNKPSKRIQPSQDNSIAVEEQKKQEIIHSITIEARLTCSLKEKAEIPPTEVDFQPIGSSYCYFQNNAEKHPLKFNSPVLFRLINGNKVTIINKYSLDQDSDLLLSPTSHLSKFDFLKVPIITVVYGSSFDKMLRFEIIAKINGQEVLYESWAYDVKFELGPAFDIPLTKLINQIQSKSSLK